MFLERGFGTFDNVLVFWFDLNQGAVMALYIGSVGPVQLSMRELCGNQDSYQLLCDNDPMHA